MLRHGSRRKRHLFCPTELCCYICLWLYNPLLDLRRFFQFLGLLCSRYDALGGGSARRKDATCTQDSKNTEETQTDIHASRFEPSNLVFERAKAVHALDRAHCDRLVFFSFFFFFGIPTTNLDFSLELKDSISAWIALYCSRLS
jgi:hypothetical protein